MLLLHTLAAQDGFSLAKLQAEQGTLATLHQELAGVDQRLGSPARLQAAASQLGMVPATDPAFVRLRDGRVIGHPAPPPPVQPAAPVAHAHGSASQHATGHSAGAAGKQPAAHHATAGHHSATPATPTGHHRSRSRPKSGHGAPARPKAGRHTSHHA